MGARNTTQLMSPQARACEGQSDQWLNDPSRRKWSSCRIGAGEEFRGEGILAVTKALLECGVAYVGGYQGAPISHLMDVLADAQDILGELGVHFESSASEATAAATLAASDPLSDPRRRHLQVAPSAPTSPPTRSPISPPAA